MGIFGKEANFWVPMIACLLFLSSLLVNTGMSCPTGNNVIHRTDGSCCKTIKCLKNQGYILCSSRNTLGYDSCYDCPIGTVNELPMDTSEIKYNFGIQEEQCSKIDCDCLPEAELLNRDECQRTGNKECACRRQDLRYGDDPQACEGPVNDSDKLSLIRTPGYELKNTGTQRTYSHIKGCLFLINFMIKFYNFSIHCKHGTGKCTTFLKKLLVQIKMLNNFDNLCQPTSTIFFSLLYSVSIDHEVFNKPHVYL